MELEKKDQEHQIAMDGVIIRGESKRADWGIWIAGGVSLAFLGSGVCTILNGHDWAGTVLGTSGFLGVVGTFVYGTRFWARRSQEESKQIAESANPPAPPKEPAPDSQKESSLTLPFAE
jgi:hypothetical protein